MSSLKAEIVRINRIESHPNADRLEICFVDGMDWPIITRKGEYAQEDLALYLPIDSVLPIGLEAFLFPPDSKIKLSGSRIRTVKIRGIISQGMLITVEEIALYLGIDSQSISRVGEDLTKELGVTKYEPPAQSSPQTSGQIIGKNRIHSDFYKFTDIENIKRYADIIQEGEAIAVSEKIHGSNWRAAYVKTRCDSFISKVRRFFGLLPAYSFTYGSHNVELDSPRASSFYPNNIYWEMVEKYKIKEILRPGEQLFGEIYGDGVQKGYNYGCNRGERRLVVYDAMKDGKYLNHDEFIEFLEELDNRIGWENPPITMVPILYTGPYKKELVDALVQGPSRLSISEPIKEGIVIKPIKERLDNSVGRVILKQLNPEYLLQKENSDWH